MVVGRFEVEAAFCRHAWRDQPAATPQAGPTPIEYAGCTGPDRLVTLEEIGFPAAVTERAPGNPGRITPFARAPWLLSALSKSVTNHVNEYTGLTGWHRNVNLTLSSFDLMRVASGISLHSHRTRKNQSKLCEPRFLDFTSRKLNASSALPYCVLAHFNGRVQPCRSELTSSRDASRWPTIITSGAPTHPTLNSP